MSLEILKRRCRFLVTPETTRQQQSKAKIDEVFLREHKKSLRRKTFAGKIAQPNNISVYESEEYIEMEARKKVYF